MHLLLVGFEFKYIKASELVIEECIVFIAGLCSSGLYCTAGLCLCQWVALTLVACTRCHSHYLSYCSCQQGSVTGSLAVLKRVATECLIFNINACKNEDIEGLKILSFS